MNKKLENSLWEEFQKELKANDKKVAQEINKKSDEEKAKARKKKPAKKPVAKTTEKSADEKAKPAENKEEK